MTWIPFLVGQLARLYPWTVTYSDDLVDALSFVDSSVSPETIVRAGYGAGIVVFVLGTPLLIAPLPPLVVGPCLLALTVLTVHGVHTAPNLYAAFRRTEALGDAPNLVGRAVLRMQVQPSLESAVRFSADTGHGPLTRSLSAHIYQSMGTPRTGLLSFADEWADRFPALRRSAHLLAMAQDAPEGERARTLDRSLRAILDGTRNRMAEFTSSIQSPTTGLFAFGVMLPLALVALVPTVPIAGFDVTIWYFVVIYNVLLPVGLIAASLWLLVRRPVAFPPPTVGSDHPDVPGNLWLRGLWGLVAGAGAFTITSALGLGGLEVVVGIGFGLGFALVVIFKPILEVRNYVREVETHLTDALYLVGRQVSEGESVESAIELASDRVPGETGAVFDHVVSLQNRLHLGVEEAFLGEYGALRNVPSPRARSTAILLAIASDEGQPAGRAIVAMADHLEELEDVESEAKRQLMKVTDTLESTTAYFGPLVAGATVGMSGLMAGDTVSLGEEAATFPTDGVAIVIAVYVVLLCFILTPLSIGLRNGIDRALIGYHVGWNLLSAMALYVGTVFLIGLI
ncbi:type II secretion system F family protein [Natrialbaceae archaeon A-gly3]